MVPNTPTQNHQEQSTQEAEKPSRTSANVNTSIPSPRLNISDNTDQAGQTKLVTKKDESVGYSSSVRDAKSQDNTQAIERQGVDDQPKLDKPTGSLVDPVTRDREIQAQQTNFEKKQINEAASKEIDKSEGSSPRGNSDTKSAAPRKLDNATFATPSFSGRAPNDPRELRKRNEQE